MALTKITIIEKISEKNNLKPSEAKDAIESMLEIMKSTLTSGEDIMTSGFGKFQVNEKAPRKGRNPATGREMIKEKITNAFVSLETAAPVCSKSMNFLKDNGVEIIKKSI